MERARVTGIATKDGYTYFSTRLRLKDVASWMREARTPLRFVSVGEGRVSFLCEDSVAAIVRECAAGADETLEDVKNIAIVSVVGEGLSNSNQFLTKCLEVLAESDQRCLLLSSNSLSLTVAVPAEGKAVLAQRLHAALVEGELEA